jgi:hypothetical protein
MMKCDIVQKFGMPGRKREARLRAYVPGIHVLASKARKTWMHRHPVSRVPLFLKHQAGYTRLGGAGPAITSHFQAAGKHLKMPDAFSVTL